jgi:hypothetical protein
MPMSISDLKPEAREMVRRPGVTWPDSADLAGAGANRPSRALTAALKPPDRGGGRGHHDDPRDLAPKQLMPTQMARHFSVPQASADSLD